MKQPLLFYVTTEDGGHMGPFEKQIDANVAARKINGDVKEGFPSVWPSSGWKYYDPDNSFTSI